MAQVKFQSYDQNGKKLSFANWVSNISPEETPFVSATGKESIDQTKFSWQVDALAPVAPAVTDATTIPAGANAQKEGADAVESDLKRTRQIDNQTQIFTKTVFVSDTANATSNYGRGKELMYQLEKASAEIKRDVEAAFLGNGPASAGSATTPRITGGVAALTGYTGAAGSETVNQAGHTGVSPDPDTGAKVVYVQATSGGSATGSYGFSETELFDLTAELYTAGAKADTIMINPVHARTFTHLQDTSAGATRIRYFENRKDIVLQVNTITDPLGQTFKVVYNRQMPKDMIFIFSPSDWTQMVLRAPQRQELAKTGDATKYMISMEAGLRHRNPCASGIMKLKAK